MYQFTKFDLAMVTKFMHILNFHGLRKKHLSFTPRFDIWRWTEPSEEKSGLGNVKVYLWLNPNNARNAESHLKPSPLTLGCLGGAGALQPLGGDFAMNPAALQLSLIDLNPDEDDP